MRAIEERCKPVANLPALLSHERAISRSLDGRSVLDDGNSPPRKFARQLPLF